MSLKGIILITFLFFLSTCGTAAKKESNGKEKARILVLDASINIKKTFFSKLVKKEDRVDIENIQIELEGLDKKDSFYEYKYKEKEREILELEVKKSKDEMRKWEGINQEIRGELGVSNEFEVISLEDQKKALSKMKDCSTKNCALDLGKILFAKYILSSTLDFSEKFNSLCIIFKMTDVEKGLYYAGHQKCFLADEKYLKEEVIFLKKDCFHSYTDWSKGDCDKHPTALSKDVEGVENGKKILLNKNVKEIIQESLQALIENFKKKKRGSI